MKEYVVLTIVGNTIVFDFRTILDEEKVFLNKNSLYKDSLYYALKYYKKHEKKILQMLLEKYNNSISIIRINKLVTFKYPFNIIEKLKIQNLVLNFLSTIGLQDYKLFLDSTSIKNIYCYYMPKEIKNNYISKGINIYMSSIKEISNKFLDQQDAFENDTLYYKNVIKIKENYPSLIEDLTEFLKINYSLKAIHLYVYTKELIESIINLVKNDESRNVIVFLHQGYDEDNFIAENFEWLKRISDKCKEEYTCEFRIIYANQFLKNNLFKQLTFNNLKLISVLCVYVCIVALIIIKSYDYIEKISIDQLKSQLISEADADEDEDQTFDYDEELPDGYDTSQVETKEEAKSKYTFTNSMSALKKINNEVKGFLTVKGTDISYPVVQHSDNSYYLNHDIYKKKTYVGWVFFDYRNNTNGFDDNNIIYGHNMPNGTMFGTLKKTLNASWKKNKDNYIISYDNDKGNFKFEVFAIYKVDYTTDYLRINFDSNEEKEAFIKMIRGRSSFKSSVKVGSEDTILTLSTCAGSNNKRLVVHAVLIKDKEGE